jgi:hypothetical protein
LSDGLHPNALGYLHMAQTWDTALHPSTNLAVAVVGPANNQAFTVGASISATATVVNAIGAYTVHIYTNSASGAFAEAGAGGSTSTYLSGSGSVTLTLVNPAKFMALQFLETTRTMTWYATLNFSNGTSTTTSTWSDPDWTATGSADRRQLHLGRRKSRRRLRPRRHVEQGRGARQRLVRRPLVIRRSGFLADRRRPLLALFRPDIHVQNGGHLAGGHDHPPPVITQRTRHH